MTGASRREPTEEQRAVIEHPEGEHARVLAVAGSGKTTTLVHRIAHLVKERRVAPERILVVMFNALARKQFKERAAAHGLPAACMQRIHTFHSYAYTVLKGAGRLPPSLDVWIEDKVELQRRCVHAAIGEMERAGRIAAGEIDPEEALAAIGLWKGALVPPDPRRAGHSGHPLMPEVYVGFERLRIERKGVTFDDFVPMAVDLLRDQAGGSGSRYAHVVVDEYQDINYGQQVMVETIAGRHAEVMVVGDDDQTIFEWRGARPDYIRELFPRRFPERATRTYTLTTSFRFGPLIAQCADNVVGLNESRHPKAVIAHQPRKPGRVEILESHSEQSSEVDQALCREIERWCEEYRARGVADFRGRIVVLGRTFSQLAGLEGEFLRRKVPYRVLGRAPFLERREVVALLDYVRVARAFTEPMDGRVAEALASIVNMPNRRISTADVRQAISLGRQREWSPRRTLEALADDRTSTLPRDLRARVVELAQRLERLGELAARSDMYAHDVLEWLVNAVDFRKHFRDFFGQGEDSLERLGTLEAFLRFSRSSSVPTLAFLEIVDAIDPTCGAPPEEQILFTTVYRTKGLEFDNVVIPSCVEGMMPTSVVVESPAYDLANPEAEPVASTVLENERRLFYVAITRAKEQVIIGTVDAPRLGLQLNASTPSPSRFLEEVRLEGTHVVAGGLAGLSTQQTVVKYVGDVIAAYSRDTTLGGAVRNLAERYLPVLGLTRAAERLERLLAEQPPTEFRHSREFPPLGNPQASPKQDHAAQRLPVLPELEPEPADAWYD